MSSVVSEGLMSRETSTLGQNILNFIDYVLLTVGIVTNVINTLVFTRPNMRSSSSHYLVAMSVVRLVNISLRFIEALCKLLVGDFLTHALVLAYLYHAGYAMLCTKRMQYVLHCLVSTERLLAVLVPLKAKNYVIATRPAIFIVGFCVITCIGNIQYSLKYEIIEDTGSNATTLLRYTDVYRRHWDLFETLTIVARFIFVYGALICLVVTNVLTIVALGKHTAERRLMDTNVDSETMRRRDNQMTLTVLVSTLLFVFFCLPIVTHSIAFNLVPDRYGPFSVQIWLFFFMDTLGNTLSLLAMSTDFFSYVALSTPYRNRLRRLTKNLLPLGFVDKSKKYLSDMFSVTKD